jgi:hypothetical protein
MKKLNKSQITRLEKWVELTKDFDDWEYDVKGYGCDKANSSFYLGQDLNKALDEIPVKYKEELEGASVYILGVHGLNFEDHDTNKDIIENELIGEIEFQYSE